MSGSKEAKKHGGVRKGAGRPPILKDAIRRNITFERQHLEKLDIYVERHGLRGYSDAIRRLINCYVRS